MKQAPKIPEELSLTEVRERVRRVRALLDVHRLPSPERLQALEQLVRYLDELLKRQSQASQVVK